MTTITIPIAVINNDNNGQESENDDDGDALQIALRKMSPNNLAFLIQVQRQAKRLGQFSNLGAQIYDTIKRKSTFVILTFT